jgi:hypothetical protein
VFGTLTDVAWLFKQHLYDLKTKRYKILFRLMFASICRVYKFFHVASSTDSFLKSPKMKLKLKDDKVEVLVNDIPF